MKTTAKTTTTKTTDNTPLQLQSPAPDPDTAPGPDTAPDWGTPYELCGAAPTLPITAMCGPCTFGEAETAGGNW